MQVLLITRLLAIDPGQLGADHLTLEGGGG